MTAKRLVLLLLASVAVALMNQWSAIENQHLKLKQLSDIACDMVAARAQAGSTRDVHDQLYSFWHKHSPDLQVDVLVKRGEKEIGSHNSIKRKNAFVQTCQIENRPDYEISFQFADDSILSLPLIEKFAVAFIVLLMMSFLLWICLRTARELWSGHILREIYSGLGLEGNPILKSKLLSRFLAKIFINSASSLRPAIEKLQRSLRDNQSELTVTKELITKFEEEHARANQFANMVTMVRHDLRGPLSALKITVSGLNQMPDEASTLRQTITSIEKIISDLDQRKAAVSAASKEILTLELAEVVIQEVVCEKSSFWASKNDIKVDFEYNPDNLSPVMCNPNHLHRMIANLLQNANEASPKVSVIRVGVRQAQGFVLIEVADQGSGIALEVLPRLFERGATFGKTNGTGEGLAFVKSKAECFGGSIKVVESSVKGTIFQLKLPLATTGAHFQAYPAAMDCERLAILDDEIDIQKFAWSNKPGKREYFKSPHALLDWTEATPESKGFSYLVDLHLKDIVTGIDVIRTLGKDKKSYLATSDYLNPQALELSAELGIAIIPKVLLFSANNDL